MYERRLQTTYLVLARNEWQHITGVSVLLPRNKQQLKSQFSETDFILQK